MNKERKLIIAGNWKMNKTVAEALDLVRGLKMELANVKEVDIVVCPAFTALSEVSRAILDSNGCWQAVDSLWSMVSGRES